MDEFPEILIDFYYARYFNRNRSLASEQNLFAKKKKEYLMWLIHSTILLHKMNIFNSFYLREIQILPRNTRTKLK